MPITGPGGRTGSERTVTIRGATDVVDLRTPL
jgi:hypothetical protein